MGTNKPRPTKRPITPGVVRSNCINCGAPLGTLSRCEYCGTFYGSDFSTEEDIQVNTLYADGKAVYQEFARVAYDIGIKLPIKEQR